MVLKNWNKSSFLLAQFVAVVLGASYYQREYSRYVFTIPGFDDSQRRLQNDAQTWCSQNGSKLLAITDSSVQSAVVMFINEAIRLEQMTGNNVITDGKRTSGDWFWINQTTKSPLTVGGQEGGYGNSFVYLYTTPSGFTLFADVPTDNYNYICEGQIFCGLGSQIFQSPEGQCFQSFSESTEIVSWFEARNRCLQRGGDLATFEFISTNDGLNALNGSWINPTKKYWIGLRRQWWTWQSINSDVTYSQWSVGDPVYDVNQECLCFVPIDYKNNNWKWNKCQCSQIYQFICISSSGTTTALTSIPSTIPTTTSFTRHLGLSSQFSSSLFMTQNPTTNGNASNEVRSTTSPASRDNALAIGLGVGLGVGFLLIATVIIVLILLKRKGYLSFRRKGTIPRGSQPLPDVTVSTAVYADIPVNFKDQGSTPDDVSDASKTATEYAPLEIIQVSRTNTLAPSDARNQSDWNDGQQYGQVNKNNRTIL